MDTRDRNERDVRDAGMRNHALDDTATRSVNTGRVDRDPTVGEEVGEAAGGISGALAGAALGSLGGPVGTIIGGLAGAIGGWWAGRAIADAAHHYTDADDSYYRTHFESSRSGLADRRNDDVRPAYQLGHLAGRNPDYAGRSFDEVEGDLRRGWSDDVRARHGDWDAVRPYARDAYERGKAGAGGAAATGTVSGAAAYGAGRVAGGAAELGRDVARGAERLGDRVADAADDVKDRVDANPASRPGRDPTDRPGR